MKNLILQSCWAIENNQVKCSNYSLLFSIHADDSEQHSTSSGLSVGNVWFLLSFWVQGAHMFFWETDQLFSL